MSSNIQLSFTRSASSAASSPISSQAEGNMSGRKVVNAGMGSVKDKIADLAKSLSQGLDKKPLLDLGVSTSAYQIEGAWNKDGKGVSIWDYFTHSRGIENGDIACDDYNRVSETISLLKELGVTTYRFSIAWTRIQPNGIGEPNPLGLSYYRHLIAELNRAGIKPMVTLYHWDLPQALEEKGGWTNRDTVIKYVEYAKILFKEFGSQVQFWITHNEPRVVSTRGYGSSTMAPGLNDPGLIPIVNHHLLLSHGLAVQAYRQLNLAGKIGISLNLKPVYCFEGGDAAKAVAADLMKNRSYLEPILLGKYPNLPQGEASFIKEGDMDSISQPIDFLGVNYYSREVISPTPFVPKAVNSLGWETYPQGLYDLLTSLKSQYPLMPPIIITENGFADHLEPSSNSPIHDDERIQYIEEHLAAVLEAIADGVPVTGYLVWSLLDNLEWFFGYAERFGLVYVDTKTQVRIPKDSFYAFQKLILTLLKDRIPS